MSSGDSCPPENAIKTNIIAFLGDIDSRFLSLSSNVHSIFIFFVIVFVLPI
jgi:hypothetical protein